MPRTKNTGDTATMQMALIGYEVEKQKIEGQIREIQALLGGRRAKVASPGSSGQPRTRRVMSAAARKRIAAAQRKRWAEYRAKKAS